MTQQFYGKFRGTVINNVDPMLQGRIQASVPDVSSLTPTSWCTPCMPVVGLNSGIFAVPPIGAGVWIEFEQGDPDHPIWVGCYTGSTADVPALANTAPAPVSAITIQSQLKNGMVICDAAGPMGAGGVTLQSATGATIAVNDTGIIITNGKGAQITMIGPVVDINNGALTIT